MATYKGPPRKYSATFHSRKLGKLDITLRARGPKEAREKVREICDALGLESQRVYAAVASLKKWRAA